MQLPVESSRPSKFTNAQTILYEIAMLRFTAGDLAKADTNDPSSWRNLECFLLHFRNLIEFFGRPKPSRVDDLNIRKPEKIWPDPATRPSADALTPLCRKDLFEKYEVRDKAQVDDKISRYLRH